MFCKLICNFHEIDFSFASHFRIDFAFCSNQSITVQLHFDSQPCHTATIKLAPHCLLAPLNERKISWAFVSWRAKSMCAKSFCDDDEDENEWRNRDARRVGEWDGEGRKGRSNERKNVDGNAAMENMLGCSKTQLINNLCEFMRNVYLVHQRMAWMEMPI